MSSIRYDNNCPTKPYIEWTLAATHKPINSILLQIISSNIKPQQHWMFHCDPDNIAKCQTPIPLSLHGTCIIHISEMSLSGLSEHTALYSTKKIHFQSLNISDLAIQHLNSPAPDLVSSDTSYLVIFRPSFNEAIVNWVLQLPQADVLVLRIDPQIPDNPSWYFHIPVEASNFPRGAFKIPRKLSSGEEYRVVLMPVAMVKLWDGSMGFKTLMRLQTQFKTDLQLHELGDLQQRALCLMARRRHAEFKILPHFFRNKSRAYFDDILQVQNGVMKPYFKDRSGDSASPINGKLKGLFFGAAWDKMTGEPPLQTIYGDTRISIPACHLMTSTNSLYFVDYYCYKFAHYVTLALTKSGSRADAFCREKLIRLDLSSNPFLICNGSTVAVTTRMHIEVFYTESINLLQYTQSLGAKFSTCVQLMGKHIQGVPKNPWCASCNLDPLEDGEETFEQKLITPYLPRRY